MKASVIIPTFGRGAALGRALESLLAQPGVGTEVEIVVVDNNSEPSFVNQARESCEKAGKVVRYTHEPSPGQTAARHRGAREARGELLFHLDDDVIVSDGWLEAMLSSFEDRDVVMAGGPSLPSFQCSVPAWFWDSLRPTSHNGWCCGWQSLLDIGEDVANIDPIWIWGLNFGVRRSPLSELGGFHPDLVPNDLQRGQGDGETGLGLRVKQAGARARHNAIAFLHHEVNESRLTISYFCQRASCQGVCDSFSSIRAGTDPVIADSGPKAPPPPPGKAATWGSAAREVRLQTTTAYNQGGLFHQREAAGNPHLLALICRDEFWDADTRTQPAKRS